MTQFVKTQKKTSKYQTRFKTTHKLKVTVKNSISSYTHPYKSNVIYNLYNYNQ